MSDHDNDRFLGEMFEAARREAPRPSADLMTRVLSDADAAQPQPQPQVPKRPRSFALWLEALGGWGGIGGLVAASVFGLWLGLSAGLDLAGLGEALASGAGVDALDADYVYLADMGDL